MPDNQIMIKTRLIKSEDLTDKVFVKKHKGKGDCFTIPNQLANDMHRIKDSAALLIHMLHRPPKWRFSETELMRSLCIGHKAFKKKLNRLIELGYAQKFQSINPDNTFGNSVIYVYSSPNSAKSCPLTPFPPSGNPPDGNPLDGNPSGGNGTPYKQRYINKEIKENNKKKNIKKAAANNNLACYMEIDTVGEIAKNEDVLFSDGGQNPIAAAFFKEGEDFNVIDDADGLKNEQEETFLSKAHVTSYQENKVARRINLELKGVIEYNDIVNHIAMYGERRVISTAKLMKERSIENKSSPGGYFAKALSDGWCNDKQPRDENRVLGEHRIEDNVVKSEISNSEPVDLDFIEKIEHCSLEDNISWWDSLQDSNKTKCFEHGKYKHQYLECIFDGSGIKVLDPIFSKGNYWAFNLLMELIRRKDPKISS